MTPYSHKASLVVAAVTVYLSYSTQNQITVNDRVLQYSTAGIRVGRFMTISNTVEHTYHVCHEKPEA